MKQKVFVWLTCAAGLLLWAAPASAQYGARGLGPSTPAENYHVEASLNFWSVDPDIEVASDSMGIVGTRIDAVDDLGFGDENFRDLRVVLRPTRKLKFRVGYTPIKFDAEAILERTVVFNGQTYAVGLPVNSELDWKAWRFGLQYDFIYRDRGFLGLIAEAKYTDATVRLDSPVASEFASVTAPIPTVGLAARVYVTRSVAVNGEISGLKVDFGDDEGTYADVDLGVTFNIGRHFGVQGGYRVLNVDYVVDEELGDFSLKGLYFGGTARF
jgi:hypothetical protein